MARNDAATNAGVGQASVTTRIKLTIQAARKCFTYGAVPMFVLPLAFWAYNVTPEGFDLVKLKAQTFVSSETSAKKWRMRDQDGNRVIISTIAKDGSLVQFLTPAQVMRVIGPYARPIRIFNIVFLISLGLGVAGYFAVWRLFTYRGEAQQTNKRIRGAFDIVEPSVLGKLVKKDGASGYTLTGIPLPREAPMRGILAIGAQGSGKSLAIHDLMGQVFARKRKSVIFDQSGEFFRAYFRPGKDIFFNPAMVGSIPWSIFAGMKYTYDANTLAQAFLPPKASNGTAGANSFFEDAARALFSVIVSRLTQRGAKYTRQIAQAFLEMPEDEMAHLIQNSVASSSVGGDSKGQRQGVISSISIYLDGIASVNDGEWSINDWLAADDDSRLFLLGSEDTKAMFAPLYRLILQTAFSAIAARQEVVHEDRYWFFLDEAHELGDVKIDSQLATLRKFGVCVLAGTQNDSQFVTSLGKDRAEVAMGGFNSLLQLAMYEPKSAERAALRLGKSEMETISQNQAVAVVEQRDGAGIVINEQEKWLVMPADISQLQTCTGYLKYAGGYPTALTNYRSWLPKKPGQRSRIDAFQPTVENPPRDPRFLIRRKELPSGQTAFDDVKLQVEEERAVRRAAEAEKKKEETKDVKNDQSLAQGSDGTSVTVDLSMTSGATDHTKQKGDDQQIQLGL